MNQARVEVDENRFRQQMALMNSGAPPTPEERLAIVQPSEAMGSMTREAPCQPRGKESSVFHTSGD